MTTAGDLVFQGRADGEFLAYHAGTGDRVWSINLGSGISAPPITYAIDGVQYVSVLVGWGGAAPALGGSQAAQHGWAYRVHPRRLFTFALRGEVPVPYSPPPVVPKPIDVAGLKLDPALVAEGRTLYGEICVLCHGGAVISGGKAPDLPASPIATDRDSFAKVVRNGRQILGMPRFREFGDREIDALFYYIRHQAREGTTTASRD